MKINGTKIEQVTEFIYLGHKLLCHNDQEAAVNIELVSGGQPSVNMKI